MRAHSRRRTTAALSGLAVAAATALTGIATTTAVAASGVMTPSIGVTPDYQVAGHVSADPGGDHVQLPD